MVYSRRHIPSVFLDDLHRLDATLEPVWNTDKERWEIHRGGKYIMTVQTVEGDFAPLDNRILQKLFLIDTHRYANEFGFIRDLRLADDKLMTKKRHEQDEYVRSCYRDMAPFLRGRKSVVARIKDDGAK